MSAFVTFSEPNLIICVLLAFPDSKRIKFEAKLDLNIENKKKKAILRGLTSFNISRSLEAGRFVLRNIHFS